MTKINFYDTKKVKSKDLKDLQDNINQSLETLGIFKYGIIKKGLNLSLENNNLKCTPGFGFTPSGKFIQVKNPLTLELNKEKITFIYLKYSRNDIGKESGTLALETYSSIEENDPYKVSVFSKEDVLVIGCFFSNSLYSLNREENIPNFPIGVAIPYKGRFIDYTTLRGCKTLPNFDSRYIKLEKESLKLRGNKEFKLNSNQIPSFGSSYSGHSISGYTDTDGEHRHTTLFPKKVGGGSMTGSGDAGYGFREPNYWKGTEYDGRHSHNYEAEYLNSNPIKIPLEPEYINLNLIIREY